MNIWIILGVGLGAPLLGLLAVSLVVRSLPVDYFIKGPEISPKRISPGSIASFLFRNILGIILIVGGLVLLLPIFPLVPGTGFVISAAGIILTDIPGKQNLLRRFARNPKILNGLNWLRRKLGRGDFLPPLNEEESAKSSTAEKINS